MDGCVGRMRWGNKIHKTYDLTTRHDVQGWQRTSVLGVLTFGDYPTPYVNALDISI